jgi:hypothetical protein
MVHNMRVVTLTSLPTFGRWMVRDELCAYCNFLSLGLPWVHVCTYSLGCGVKALSDQNTNNTHSYSCLFIEWAHSSICLYLNTLQLYVYVLHGPMQHL